MSKFSHTSAKKLSTCNIALQNLFDEVIRHFDCTVLEGVRTQDRQDELVKAGKSQTHHSKHLTGNAIDVAPYPIDWADTQRFHYFAGFVKGIAAAMGISVRWGGDWDNDTEVDDNTFDDLPHFELKEVL